SIQVDSGTAARASFNLTNVALGKYAVTVALNEGCSVALPGAFTVTDPAFALTGIDPPFGCTCEDTTVTLTSDAHFRSTPMVEMRLTGQPTAAPIPFKRVAWIDSNTLTAVVPGGAALGEYDVTVRNPGDGKIGFLAKGFRVVSRPVPQIVAVTPGRGTSQADVPVTIHGDNFRNPAVVELVDEKGAVAVSLPPVAPVSASRLEVTIPTRTRSTALPTGPYLVRVVNQDEKTYTSYSNFLVTNPSGNLNRFQSTSPLGTARRLLAGTSADDVNGNHYVYAIGGDAGAGAALLDTVEVSQLSKFGELGRWEAVPNRLQAPRTGAAAVAVPVFESGSAFLPVKTYVYVLGGRSTSDAVLDTVERAVVLSPKEAPVITAVTAAAAG
ncbi:MAG: IPT/TIG domain-containing protein, partial [Myxococcales bacterium]